MAQKHLILILARELASNLATPTLIADAEGNVVFYNEAAEAVIGGPFSEMGEMGIDDLAESYAPRNPEGERLPRGAPAREGRARRAPRVARARSGSRAGTESIARWG